LKSVFILRYFDKVKRFFMRLTTCLVAYLLFHSFLERSCCSCVHCQNKVKLTRQYQSYLFELITLAYRSTNLHTLDFHVIWR